MIVLLAFGIVAAACTPNTDGSPETTSPEVEPVTTTAGPTTPTTAPDSLEAPERGDPNDVASDAFWDAGDFTLAGEPTLFDEDALTTIERWLPEDLVAGLVWEVYTRDSDTNVLAVSVIPTPTWRGDPNFITALISTLTETVPTEVGDGIFQTDTAGGLVLSAWSTGDGFVIATSTDDELSVDYLKALSTESEPQGVWEADICLYTDPDTETLPYAPFPPDLVVPCSGPHNAEVILSEQIGIDLDDFEDDAIEYERNYRCDATYNEIFGSQKAHKPSLITYMPDEDEWDRGDRYLACVVQLTGTDGPLLISGPLSGRTDLDWAPEAGDCLDRSFAPQAIDCGRPHGYQYLGDATVELSEWPVDGTAAFQQACSALLDDSVKSGPVPVEVFPTGLYAYAFEQGDRTVQCMAFATEDGLLADVAGSFDGVWRVIGSGGIAA
jgi:hypothetical protein